MVVVFRRFQKGLKNLGNTLNLFRVKSLGSRSDSLVRGDRNYYPQQLGKNFELGKGLCILNRGDVRNFTQGDQNAYLFT